MRLILAAALIALPSLSSAQASKTPESGVTSPQAPVSSEPQATSATYGDWVLVCQREAEKATQRICEISQSIQVQGQQGPIAQIAIAKPKQGMAISLIAVLPPNILLTSGPRVSVDDKDTQGVDLAWARCLPGGCFAETSLKDDVLKKWRDLTDRGQLEFKDAGGRNVIIPFSFKGLSAAYGALEKD